MSRREPMTRERMLHPANIALAVIALLFTAWEIVAAVYDRGSLSIMVTLSEYVWWLRDNLPWLGYPLILLFCGWLTFHFLFQGR